MGAAPPKDFPISAGASSNGGAVTFGSSAPIKVQGPCGFNFDFALPAVNVSFDLSLFFSLPFPFLALKLTCDPNNPIDLSAGLKPGGGRVSTALPDPDLVEDPVS